MYKKKIKKYSKYKICTYCKKKLIKKEFRKSGKYLASRCTSCAVELQREQHLKNKYGISLDQFDKLLEKQKYTCDICNKPSQTKNRRLCVDHDHITGKVRGLLCDLCNTALGKFQEDRELLLKAEKYLKKHGK